MKTTYQFKLDQRPQGVNWQNSPVFAKIETAKRQKAVDMAYELSRKYSCEIRMNEAGSLQGYYFNYKNMQHAANVI